MRRIGTLHKKRIRIAGKTLRLNDDGTIPKDNPFVGKAGYRPEIWTIGNRNAQGLAFQPGSGLACLKPSTGRAVLKAEAAAATKSIFSKPAKITAGLTIHHTQTREGMVSPLLEYSPACAPASAMFYNGDAFPAFKGNFFFGCLRGTRIIRVVLDGRKVVKQENLLEGTYRPHTRDGRRA